MVSRFPGAITEVIWIVGILEGQGTHLSFPGGGEPNISFSIQDDNQGALDMFDQLGFRVWLQVEPGDAQVETLFDLILTRYGNHSCVIGVGVDVEWGWRYYPAPVAFQIGYPADKKWWGKYSDPARTIGEAILKTVPNAMGLFWVDFTALEVFPP